MKKISIMKLGKLVYTNLLLSHVQLFVTPWTVALQDPLPMGFPRQEYWSGLPLSSPGPLPYPGIKPGAPTWQVDSLPLGHLGSQSLDEK